MARFNVAVDAWQKANIKLGEILKLPEEEFQELRGELLSFVVGELQYFKKWTEESGNTTMVTLTGGMGNAGAVNFGEGRGTTR